MKLFCLFILSLGFANVGAQCLTDRHNTSLESAWTSCQTSANPNTVRGVGHWIMYDFTFDYSVGQLHFWNFNHPDYLNRGARDISIDISMDGASWTSVSDYTIPQANGLSSYEGVDGPMLNQRARYMLITVNNNYGDACASIGEIRIEVADEIDCPPNYTVNGNLGNRKYHATNTILTTGVVQSENTVHFQAGNNVDMNVGFEVQSLSELEIEIGPCN